MKIKSVIKMRLSGKVIKGKMLGRKIGSPTINIEGVFDLEYGVYACQVLTTMGKYLGALHYGPRMTLNELQPVLEVSLLDFDGDLYGETVSVDVYNRVRDIKKFAGFKELSEQIEHDIASIRKLYD